MEENLSTSVVALDLENASHRLQLNIHILRITEQLRLKDFCRTFAVSGFGTFAGLLQDLLDS